MISFQIVLSPAALRCATMVKKASFMLSLFPMYVPAKNHYLSVPE